jgi:hypothetical protein
VDIQAFIFERYQKQNGLESKINNKRNSNSNLQFSPSTKGNKIETVNLVKKAKFIDINIMPPQSKLSVHSYMGEVDDSPPILIVSSDPSNFIGIKLKQQGMPN